MVRLSYDIATRQFCEPTNSEESPILILAKIADLFNTGNTVQSKPSSPRQSACYPLQFIDSNLARSFGQMDSAKKDHGFSNSLFSSVYYLRWPAEVDKSRIGEGF